MWLQSEGRNLCRALLHREAISSDNLAWHMGDASPMCHARLCLSNHGVDVAWLQTEDFLSGSGQVQVRSCFQIKFNLLELDSELGQLVKPTLPLTYWFFQILSSSKYSPDLWCRNLTLCCDLRSTYLSRPSPVLYSPTCPCCPVPSL